MKGHKIISASLLAALSFTAYAEENVYIGAEYLSGDMDTGISNVTGASLDENTNGYKILIGYKANETIAIEGFYADFGEAKLSGSPGDTFVYDGLGYIFLANGTLKYEVTGLGIAGKFNANISDKFNLNASIGLLSWTSTVSLTGYGSDDDNGSDLFFGIGATYDITDKVGIGVGYEVYQFGGDTDIDMKSLNLGIQVSL